MDPIKVLIVEDNALMASVLSDLIRRQEIPTSLLGVASSGTTGLKLINEKRPDVVFLDIELPDMTGFEMLARCSKITFKTIFTTAHSKYAIRAFRFNALDYLLKPIVEEELQEALERANSTNSQGIQNALHNMQVDTPQEQRLVLSTQKGTLYLPIRDITHVEGDRNYSTIHLVQGGTELSSKNLAYFEDLLEEKGIFRCHRSYLVNRLHVLELKEDAFALKSGVQIPVSRRKKRSAEQWFAQD